MNLDRFSRVLHGERFQPSPEMLEEQRELVKRDIVRDRLSWHNLFSEKLPTAEFIQDELCHLDLDLDMIEKIIKEYEG